MCAADLGACMDRQESAQTINSFSCFEECSCNKVKIPPTRVIKVIIIKKLKDKIFGSVITAFPVLRGWRVPSDLKRIIFNRYKKFKVRLRSESQFKEMIPCL